jgi:hypothetical protein
VIIDRRISATGFLARAAWHRSSGPTSDLVLDCVLQPCHGDPTNRADARQAVLDAPPTCLPNAGAGRRDRPCNRCIRSARNGGFVMGIKCGIVGLPNVGKSTLFNALTQAQIAARRTIRSAPSSPNVGIVAGARPAARSSSSAIVKPERILPTTVEFVDIAGLVRGRLEGRGPRQ